MILYHNESRKAGTKRVIKLGFNQHSSGQIRYVIERSKRSAGLKVTVDAERGAVVTVPANCKSIYIDAFVRQKAGWITEKLERLAEQVGCPVPRAFVSGEMFFYLGRRYALNVTGGSAGPGVWLKGGRINVNMQAACSVGESAAVRKALCEWYKKEARHIICARVKHYSNITGLKPAGIRIKKQRCRWGSCSARGNLNFNWKLVMAPPEIIDYVVVHELCHLVRLDHSVEFWRQVAGIMPDYIKKRRWLREYGPALAF